jgi:uncharacterized protein (DUF2126 family)
VEGIQTWRTMLAKSLGARSWETRMAHRVLRYGKVLADIYLSQNSVFVKISFTWFQMYRDTFTIAVSINGIETFFLYGFKFASEIT